MSGFAGIAILLGALGVVFGASLAIAGTWPRLISKRGQLVVPDEPRTVPLAPNWRRVGLGGALVVIGVVVLAAGLGAFPLPR